MVLQGCTPVAHTAPFRRSRFHGGHHPKPAPAPSHRTLEAAITPTYTKVMDIATVAAWLTAAHPHSQLSKVGNSSLEM